MKRHASLVPLSHDHHHELVAARRLRRAADGDAATRLAAAAGFLAAFSAETLRHFREEEEVLFPALAESADPAPDELVQALLEHQRIHALVRRVQEQLAAGEADAEVLGELGATLEAHVRLEERRLFPLIERVVPEETLMQLELGRAADEPSLPVVEPWALRGRGPLWSAETEDLDVTLLAWEYGGGTPRHVNDAVDVVLVVLAGSGTVTVDGHEHRVRAGEAAIVEKGSSREIAAGPAGLRYLSLHRRRPPLEIGTARPRRAGAP